MKPTWLTPPLLTALVALGLSGAINGQQNAPQVSAAPFPSDPGLDIDARALAQWDPKVAKELANMPGKDFKWPGALPRPGSTKIFENEWLAIFDDDMSPDGGWHRHIREAVSIGIRPGRISELFMTGVINIGEAGMTTGQLPSIGRFGTGGNLTTVGHAEWSTDPDRRRRAIYIEFKGTEVAGCSTWSNLPGCEQPGSAGSAGSAGTQAPRRDGTWQMAVEINSQVPTRIGRSVATALPPFTVSQCITPRMAEDRVNFTPQAIGYAVPPRRDCSVDYIVNGARENWKVQCTAENPLKGAAEFALAGAAYSGSMTLTVPGLVRNADGTHSWREVPITMKYSGTRVGDCVKK